MKRNLTILVLLMAWSLLSIPMSPATAEAGEIPQGKTIVDGGRSPDQLMDANGAPDDDTEGDPGDAGDGYGFTPPPRAIAEGGQNGQIDGEAIDEFLLILRALVQLAL